MRVQAGVARPKQSNNTQNMNAQLTPRRHPHCSFFSPARKLLATLAGAVLLLLLGGGAARAQTTGCYTVICPTNLVLWTCTDTAVLPNNPLIVITNPACVPPPPLTINCNPAAGTPLPLGVHPVNCVAVSGGVVLAQCQFTVTVIRDTQPPHIQCPSDIVDTACPSPTGCGKVVNYPPPAASDNSGSVTVNCSPASGSFFPCGSTTVTCTAVDRCQLTATCSFTVTIQQGGQLPGITCPQDILVNTCSNCAPVLYPAPVVVNGVLVGCSPASGACFPLGVTTVTCTASNACGTRSCSFTVTVRPVPPPTIQCPTNPIIVTAPCDTNCVPVFYPLPTVGNGTLIGCNPAPGACLPVGVHVVTCRATNDCGVLVGCEFDVVVLSSQGNPPTITCPPDITVNTCSNCAPVLYPLPTVVNGVLATCNPPSGFCFPIGTTTVTCTATNDCGGAATCSFKITVRPVPPATITCPSNIVVVAPCNSNCVPVFYALPTVTDGTLIGCNPPSGACLPVGIHVVTCRATNDCGQFAGCEFQIRVISGSGNPPTITCPQDITVTTCSNCAPVVYPAPAVVGGVLAGCTPPSGTCFPLGVNLVTCTATNDCGDTAQCEFTVTVRPVPPPVITCPQDITVTTCGTCEIVNYPAPTVVGGTLINCLPPSGACFPLGVTTVTCRATNDCGVLATCKFDITVREVPPIAIVCPSNIVVTTCTNGEVVTYPAPVIVGGPAVAVYCVPPSGSFFPLGTNTVTCCAIDQCQRTNCCSFTVTVLPGNPCVKPPLNMVLWLPFDEPLGPIANNIVPGALNGLHVNGPVPFLGQHVLNSLRFDGVNDFVRVPNYAGIVLGASHFSIDSWVFRQDPVNGGRRVIVSKLTQAAGYEFYLNNGVMNLLLRTPFGTVNYNSGILVPQDGQWHFLAVTIQRGPNTVRFYLDGAPVATVTIPLPGSVGNNSALFVGASTSPLGSHWRGFLDEVEIFRRVLTPLEINQLWLAGKAGKCKIKKTVPWDVPFPPGVNCVTVNAVVWNLTPVPMPVDWIAYGPMPIPTPGGTIVVAPFSSTNIPVTICRPTNSVPVGGVLIWNLSLAAPGMCPMTMMGSVINPGTAVVTVPTNIVDIPGTNQAATVRIGLNGLPPGVPVRIRVIGPDMEPDIGTVSLNGLPPGQPVIRTGGGGFSPAAEQFDVTVRFLQIEPIGLYTILVEPDLDGDSDYDTVVSFDVSSSLVPPPALTIQKVGPQVQLHWRDMGDGLGTLESTDDVVNGTWAPVPGGAPGMTLPPAGRHQYFRVNVPITD